MNDTMLGVIIGGFVLMLVIRGIVVISRAPAGTFFKNLVIWAAIGGALYVGFNHRDQIDAFFNTDDQRAEGGTVRIQMARDGHFWARVKLNGFERRMLIDSGATITALSAETAKSAGIDPERNRPPVVIETANGNVNAASGTAQKLEIGPLKAEDVDVVISSAFGEMDVLGMNFLSRLKSWSVQGNVLVLEPDGTQASIEAAEQPKIEPAPTNGVRPASPGSAHPSARIDRQPADGESADREPVAREPSIKLRKIPADEE